MRREETPTESSEKEGERPKRRCAECAREIYLGEDALVLERVVMGPRIPVPIGELQFFHLDGCLEKYVCRSADSKLPKRIP